MKYDPKKAWRERNPEKSRRLDRESAARRRADPEKRAKDHAREKAWRAEHPEIVKAWAEAKRVKNGRWARLEKVLGVSRGAYEKMIIDQSGRCAICSAPEPRDSYLHVDHCHSTLVVRGLLCGSCNRGLGLLKESAGVLQNAIAYLMANDPAHAVYWMAA